MFINLYSIETNDLIYDLILYKLIKYLMFINS